jgi:hypothetical protein
MEIILKSVVVLLYALTTIYIGNRMARTNIPREELDRINKKN